ncbi:hypothetical protein HK100_011201 [Physocladia obscura]|uniref:WW domain-containing protein n=1 Tax=Physocladia obscura TaxID=109957 RepID=A0AAD5T2Z9_9FUNG|nr:hypothetical protein HK100_011201 [Physocladia obscura]
MQNARLQFQTKLPPGWKAEWNSERKCFYFIDPTGKCTWTDPRDPKKSTPTRYTGNVYSNDIWTMSRQPLTQNTAHYNMDMENLNSLGSNRATPNVSAARMQQSKNNRPQPQTRGKFYCGCFSTRRSCLLSCGIIWFFILTGIGAALFFLWPRYPTVKVGDPYLIDSISALQVIAGKEKSGDLTQIAVTMAVDISVYSPNYEDIFVNNLEFTGYLVDPSTNAAIKSAPASGVSNNINFKAKSTTDFTLQFTITDSLLGTVSSYESLVASDAFIHALDTDCKTASGTLTLTYSIELTLALISWTGFKPTTTGTVKIPCPATAVSLAKSLGFTST